MIAKKIINPKKTSPKHVRISRLAAYIRAPERTDTTEKCVYAAARGFHARTPAGQTCEMIALAEDAVRSRDPVTHYVLSWPTGERPTPDQVEEAVTILLDEMAIPDHQAIYGLHADTAHHHLHVLVNRAHPVPRIHPVTGELETRVVKINRGFDIEAAHRAGARIEHAQGWRIEANKRYRIAGTDGDGKPVLERTDPAAGHRRRKPSQQQIDAELRTGAPSIARRVIDLVAPILAAAAGWPDWHARLDAQGIRYARKGSGAVFILDGIAIKASRVDREATLRALEERFGPYQAHEPARTPAPLPCDLAPFFTKLLAEVENTAAASAAGEPWDRWHAGVAAGGYGYRKQGSGAVIDTGHGVFKASDVSRRITRAALEKSFGPYRAPANTVATAPPAATPEPEIPDPRAAAPRLAALLAEVDSTRDGKWRRWHAGMDALGGSYQRRGSGAVITFGGITVRATDVLRGLSLGAMQKRFGLYEPPPGPAPEPPAGRADLPEHGAYLQARDAHRRARDGDWIAYETRYAHDLKDLKRKQGAKRRGRLDAHRWEWRDRALDAEWSILAARHAAQQAELRERHHRDLDVERIILAARHAAERAELRERRRRDLYVARSILAGRHAAERAELRERRRRARDERRRRFPPWPSYEDWVRDRALPPAEQRWAHPATAPAWLEGDRDERPTPRDIRAYRPHPIGRVVVYRHRDTPDRIAFTDLGHRIRVHVPQDEAAVLAALQLAAQKWGRVRVRGSPAFQALSVRLAVRHGIAISNPALQDQIQEERAKYRESIHVARPARPVEIPARTASDRQAAIPPAPIVTAAARPVEIPARTASDRHAAIPPTPVTTAEARPVEIPARTASDRQAAIPPTPVAAAAARPVEIPARTASDRHAAIPPTPVAAAAARPVEIPARTASDRQAAIPPTPVAAAAAHPVEIPARTASDRHAAIPPTPVAAAAARPVEIPARTPSDRHAAIPATPVAAAAARPVEIPAQTASDRHAAIPPTPVAAAAARPVEIPARTASDRQAAILATPVTTAEAHPVEIPARTASDRQATIPVAPVTAATARPVEIPARTPSDRQAAIPAAPVAAAAARPVEIPARTPSDRPAAILPRSVGILLPSIHFDRDARPPDTPCPLPDYQSDRDRSGRFIEYRRDDGERPVIVDYGHSIAITPYASSQDIRTALHLAHQKFKDFSCPENPLESVLPEDYEDILEAVRHYASLDELPLTDPYPQLAEYDEPRWGTERASALQPAFPDGPLRMFGIYDDHNPDDPAAVAPSPAEPLPGYRAGRRYPRRRVWYHRSDDAQRRPVIADDGRRILVTHLAKRADIAVAVQLAHKRFGPCLCRRTPEPGTSDDEHATFLQEVRDLTKTAGRPLTLPSTTDADLQTPRWDTRARQKGSPERSGPQP